MITFLLMLGAFGFGAIGALLLSSATAGVGLIALGCLCGILARIAQAGYFHKLEVERLQASRQSRIA
jgi:hypothetical protein